MHAVQSAVHMVGNPSALHAEAVEASKALEASRQSIAAEVGCTAREIVFVSGGTEANNLAILGYLKARSASLLPVKGTHWIVSAIEHPSVLDCFGEVERMGGSVSFVQPNEGGIISADTIQNLLRPETVFVSVGWANSEIGTVQPIAAISRTISDFEESVGASITFHSDAGHAPVYKGTSVHSLGIDLLSLDSAKLYGPRGVGALYIGSHTKLSPILFGGGQERGLRPGTENIALAAGFAEALACLARMRASEVKRVEALRNSFLQRIMQSVPGLVLNGDRKHLLPNIVNVSVPDVQSEYLLLALDHAGVAVSTKSACREGEAKRSHVVEALGGEQWRSENTIRFSLGTDTTARDLKRVADIFAKAVVTSQKVGGLLRG
jgi:cysteine desulfurase